MYSRGIFSACGALGNAGPCTRAIHLQAEHHSFLPIFPFGHGHDFMACAHCGQTTALSRADAERFAADAAQYEAQRRSTETLG